MSSKKNVRVYIDGFNLYHAILNLKKPHLKWVNLRKLSEFFIDLSKEEISQIYYFSAYAKHLEKSKPQIISRHKAYVRALSSESVNVKSIMGHFKEKEVRFKDKKCFHKFTKHEEKETDVNIAIYMLRDAMNKSCNKQLLISNDTDLVPAVKMIQAENKNVEVKIITPPTYNQAYTFKRISKQKNPVKIKEMHLERCLLPEKITLNNGKIIFIPSEYRKP